MRGGDSSSNLKYDWWPRCPYQPPGDTHLEPPMNLCQRSPTKHQKMFFKWNQFKTWNNFRNRLTTHSLFQICLSSLFLSLAVSKHLKCVRLCVERCLVYCVAPFWRESEESMSSNGCVRCCSNSSAINENRMWGFLPPGCLQRENQWALFLIRVCEFHWNRTLLLSKTTGSWWFKVCQTLQQ